MDVKNVKGLRRFWGIIILLIAALLIRIFTNYPVLIERYYSTGFYPPVAAFMRTLIGWLPFSLGDIIYSVAGILIIYGIFCFIKSLVQRKVNRRNLSRALTRGLIISLLVYVYFNLAWGLNYNRLGIAHQLNIQTEDYSREDLQMINNVLVKKLNDSRAFFPDSVITIPTYSNIFDSSQAAYRNVAHTYPWLKYQDQSIKKSLYGRMGRYLGFLGYYNPFTGEAQLNLTIPRFLIPYITCHEMGHQLGYASESEASFVGYLAATHSRDSLYRYSAYFDLFSYANREYAMRDSTAAKENFNRLNRRVKGDFKQVRDYLKKTRNPLEPLVKLFYDQYLKVNQQEKGMQSYNQVVAWLIAYQKKFGAI